MSDKRFLDRISHLVDRQPLETPDSECSDQESSLKAANSIVNDAKLSAAVPLSSTLHKRVSKAFRRSQEKTGPVHEVNQKTIESIFREIQYYAKLRVRRQKYRADDGADSNETEDLKNPEFRPEGIPAETFRSTFNDTGESYVETSILDSKSFLEGQYFGFYIFFWLSVSFYILKHILQSELAEQVPLYKAPVFAIFTRGLVKIALIDLFMYLSIYVVYFIQVLCAWEVIQWRKTGRALTSIYELVFVVCWMYFVVEIMVTDQWIGRTFLMLHMFVLFMKMHSYAFYNGYLWKILRELQFSERYLERLHQGSADLPTGFELENTTKLLTGSIAFCKFELLHQSMQLDKANEKGTLEMNSAELCKTYLCFPSNINFCDFFMYTMYPTVLYTLKFARTKRIRWMFVFEKVAAMIGIIFVMLLIAEYSLYPTFVKCFDMNKVETPLSEKVNLLIVVMLDIVPPMLLEYLLTFYLIWHAILNLIAEVTRYADRDFYGHWWGLLDWEEFSRLWNKPVHRFLLRHVYHSSISAFSLSKMSGVLLTFLISSIVHELMMYVVFGRMRGYLFFFQMFQLPLIVLNKSPILKNHKTTRNVICLLGLMLAPGLIPSLYVIF